MEEKQYFGIVLPLLKSAELPGGGGNIFCDNCGTAQLLTGNGIKLWMDESDWSNCDGCLLE